MVAIGEGAKQAAMEQMEQMGANNIVVRSVKPPESNDASQKTQKVLDYDCDITEADFRTNRACTRLRSAVMFKS